MASMVVGIVMCVCLDSSVAAVSKIVHPMEHVQDTVDVNWAQEYVPAWMAGVALPVPSQS